MLNKKVAGKLSKKPNKITITDVARYAKVSKASVSRFLNGNFSALSDDLSLRIKKAIEELGYRPNQMARSLKRGSSKLIAYVLPDINNPYSIEVMQGIEQACQDHGYTMMICNTDENKIKESYYLQLLENYNVEGIIFQAQGADSKNIAQYSYPIVLLDRELNDFHADLIGIDNNHAMHIAMDYLINSGFEAFLFLTGDYQLISSRKARVTQFNEIVRSTDGIKGELVVISNKTSHVEFNPQIKTVIKKFCHMHRGMRKTIVTVNAAVALQASLAIRQLNFAWGKDIGLLSFDDPAWATVIGDGITVIRQPTYELGYSAFTCLLDRINGSDEPAKSILFKGELVVRNSTR